VVRVLPERIKNTTSRKMSNNNIQSPRNIWAWQKKLNTLASAASSGSPGALAAYAQQEPYLVKKIRNAKQAQRQQNVRSVSPPPGSVRYAATPYASTPYPSNTNTNTNTNMNTTTSVSSTEGGPYGFKARKTRKNRKNRTTRKNRKSRSRSRSRKSRV
jgi:hypothetical protein